MPHFSINLNRELHGFFKSNRGIQQGGPFVTLSFYFSIGGVGWHLRKDTQHLDFIHHWRCKENAIIHLSFVDDLMMFYHADQNSVWILKHWLEKFVMLSGLSINHTKSSLYLSKVDGQLQESIQQQLGFQQKALPVKYLGVPFITTLLTHRNCLSLMERITSRIKSWTSSALNYAGRLQLIKLVFFLIQVYCTTIFVLPRATIKKLESSHIKAYILWKDTSFNALGAKVARASICFSKKERGMRIKRLHTWNKAATLKHIWHLLTDHQLIWST